MLGCLEDEHKSVLVYAHSSPKMHLTLLCMETGITLPHQQVHSLPRWHIKNRRQTYIFCKKQKHIFVNKKSCLSTGGRWHWIKIAVFQITIKYFSFGKTYFFFKFLHYNPIYQGVSDHLKVSLEAKKQNKKTFVCPDYSQHIFENQYVHLFYDQITHNKKFRS